MACGIPSIYSNCCAQLEFAEGKGIPVNIIGEKPANISSYARYKMSDLPGNYYEPDFEDLRKVMRDAYVNYATHKSKALIDAKQIHQEIGRAHV